MSDSTVPSGVVEADARNGRIRHVGRRQGFSPYPKYKPSGVEWLGDVPEHWEVKSLGTLGYFFKGSGGTRSDRSTTGVSCIRYGDIYTSYDHHVRTSFGFVSKEESEGYTQILYGDVLFAGSGETLDEIGKSVANLIGEHTCCGGDVIVFRSAPGVLDPVFSGYALDCAHASWQKSCMGRGVTVMHIYASELKHLIIPLPIRQEQEAIGAYLEHETAKIDALIARNEVLIKHLKEQRAALISRTVTRGLPPDESRKAGIEPHPKLKPSGVEWLGDVPEHWEIDALCRVTTDIRASNVNKHVRSTEIAVKLCNYVDVYYNESIDTQINYMHGSATRRQLNIFRLREGDVLITKDSEVQDDIGVPALVTEPVPNLVAGYHLVLVRPDLQCLYGPYLFRALQSDIASLQFTHCAQGVTRYGMTYSGIKSVRLPIPPLVEQRAIAAYLDRETAKIDRAKSLARQESSLLREYRTSLISDVVTGKVDIRGVGGVESEP